MTKIMSYDYEANKLEEIAEVNDITVAEVISMLMDYVDEMKKDYNLF